MVAVLQAAATAVAREAVGAGLELRVAAAKVDVVAAELVVDVVAATATAMPRALQAKLDMSVVVALLVQP